MEDRTDLPVRDSHRHNNGSRPDMEVRLTQLVPRRESNHSSIAERPSYRYSRMYSNQAAFGGDRLFADSDNLPSNCDITLETFDSSLEHNSIRLGTRK